jgi:hypothetical protein
LLKYPGYWFADTVNETGLQRYKRAGLARLDTCLLAAIEINRIWGVIHDGQLRPDARNRTQGDGKRYQ